MRISGDSILYFLFYPSGSRPSRAVDPYHPAHASLHDVMRTIWNDPAGFSPEFRKNYYLRNILNDWNNLNVLNEAQRLNGWNDWNWLLHR